MRFALAFCAVGLCLAGSGCALLEDTSRNFAVSISRCTDEFKESKRNKRWANEAWAQLAGVYSSYYEEGFKDGFTEYLYRGGNGEPPLVAPPRYRRVVYQTPEGHLAIQDWFAGYRHGAADAHARGLRQFVVAPNSVHAVPPGLAHEDPYAVAQELPSSKALPAAKVIRRELVHEAVPPKASRDAVSPRATEPDSPLFARKPRSKSGMFSPAYRNATVSAPSEPAPSSVGPRIHATPARQETSPPRGIPGSSLPTGEASRARLGVPDRFDATPASHETSPPAGIEIPSIPTGEAGRVRLGVPNTDNVVPASHETGPPLDIEIPLLPTGEAGRGRLGVPNTDNAVPASHEPLPPLDIEIPPLPPLPTGEAGRGRLGIPNTDNAVPASHEPLPPLDIEMPPLPTLPTGEANRGRLGVPN